MCAVGVNQTRFPNVHKSTHLRSILLVDELLLLQRLLLLLGGMS